MSDEVVLLGYPVRLGAEQQEHLDDVAREFQLIALSRPQERSHVPGRLLALVDLLAGAWYADPDEPARVREEAELEGRRTVDLRYPVRPETRGVIESWGAVLAEADELCRTDDLLVLARSPQVLALQEWVVGEFLGQLAGQEPTAWSGPV